MKRISIGKTLGRCIFFSNPFKMKRSHYESDKSGFRFNLINLLEVSIVQIDNIFLDIIDCSQPSIFFVFCFSINERAVRTTRKLDASAKRKKQGGGGRKKKSRGCRQSMDFSNEG